MQKFLEPNDLSNGRRWRRRPLGRYRYVRMRWRILFTLIDFVGYRLFSLAKQFKRAVAGKNQKPTRVSCNKILLVQLDHFGDAVITCGVMPALRRHYPTAEIHVLCSPQGRGIFAALPQVNRVEVSYINRFSRNKLARLGWIPAILWWAIKMRRKRIDLAVDIRGDFPIALLLWLAGVRRRLGWACGGGGFLLTDCATFKFDRPEIQSRWALMEKIGVYPTPSEEATGCRFPIAAQPTLTDGSINRKNSSWAKDDRFSWPAGQTASDPKQIVFHLGAGTEAKRWPISHWRELLRRVLVAHDAHIVLVGNAGERVLAWELFGGSAWPRVSDHIGSLDIHALADLMRNAYLFIGADSGPAHLAAAMDIPAIVLFSGTNSVRQWSPQGQQVHVIRHEVDCSPCHCKQCPRVGHPCMRLLSPATVAEKVGQLLEGVPCPTFPGILQATG